MRKGEVILLLRCPGSLVGSGLYNAFSVMGSSVIKFFPLACLVCLEMELVPNFGMDLHSGKPL
mgnify:FL=1